MSDISKQDCIDNKRTSECAKIISKYQSGFRKAKSTNHQLFRLFRTAVESFNRYEIVIAFSLTSKMPLTMFGTFDSGIKSSSSGYQQRLL